MHKLITITALCAGLSVATGANAFSLGGSKSGNKFNYDACGDIVEGKTTYKEAEKMLGAEPISTGKHGSYRYRLYQYDTGGGAGVGAFGISVGGSKAKRFMCRVSHNKEGVVTNVDMESTSVGSSSTGM